jgi:hypothetical protein
MSRFELHQLERSGLCGAGRHCSDGRPDSTARTCGVGAQKRYPAISLPGAHVRAAVGPVPGPGGGRARAVPRAELHEKGGRLHDERERYWRERDEDRCAELERRAAAIDREIVKLERDLAAAERDGLKIDFRTV